MFDKVAKIFDEDGFSGYENLFGGDLNIHDQPMVPGGQPAMSSNNDTTLSNSIIKLNDYSIRNIMTDSNKGASLSALANLSWMNEGVDAEYVLSPFDNIVPDIYSETDENAIWEYNEDLHRYSQISAAGIPSQAEVGRREKSERV